MKVYIYSYKDIEELLKTDRFPENVGTIVIDDIPSKRSADYKSPIKLLPLYGDKTVLFLDEIENLEEEGLTKETYFPRPDRVAFFIYSMYTSGRDIVCYSRNGKSRSAACAAAILEFYYNNGASIFSDDRYTPNKLIYDILMDALEERKHIEERRHTKD